MTVSVLTAQTTPPTSATSQLALPALPDDAAQSKVLAQIKSIFADDYAKPKPADKKALAQKLLTTSQDVKADDASRYVLLSEARKLAMTVPDLETALAAEDGLEKHFTLDRAALRLDTLDKLSKKATAPPQYKELATRWMAIADEAAAADDYTTATLALARIETMVRGAQDVPFAEAVRDRAKRVQAMVDQHDRVKQALDTQAKTPSDAPSALAVGRYYCFTRDDWAKGLDYLLRGSDPALRTLAGLDINGGRTPEALVQVGDAWWTYAKNQSGPLKLSGENRAVYWYAQALPNLTGLEAVRVQGRVDSIHRTDVVDLLALVDLKRDTLEGAWTVTPEGLRSADKGSSRLELPYVPPREYDFKIEFTGNDDGIQLYQMAAANGHNFAWIMGGWDNTMFTIDCVGAAQERQGPVKKIGKLGLLGHQRMVSVIQVRHDGVETFLNGKSICKYATDYHDLVWNWKPKVDGMLGIEAHTRVTIHRAELISVAGIGHGAWAEPKK